MRMGFTGTRRGMTGGQKKALVALLEEWKIEEIHHGDCVGADDETANLANEVRPRPRIVCHPPKDESLRAFNPWSDETKPALTHFARNRAIVDATDFLVAAPFEAEHQSHGGTWYTFDYARKKGKRVLVLTPDGTLVVTDPVVRED